jgi:DNA-binding response OmpR family regulator
VALILVTEDDPVINEIICNNLKLVGHTCVSAFDGAEAFNILQKGSFDLILLDVMLPEMGGFELMKKIKGTPVIFLTAKGALQDKVRGLSLGADDYIVKPFEMLELLARVEALLRRTDKNSKIFEVGGLKVDFTSRQVFLDGQLTECAPKEFDLLEVLILNRNIALSREKLLELAWGFDYFGDTRTVDVHIQRLRKKFRLDGYIKTVFKMGYRLEYKS